MVNSRTSRQMASPHNIPNLIYTCAHKTYLLNINTYGCWNIPIDLYRIYDLAHINSHIHRQDSARYSQISTIMEYILIRNYIKNFITAVCHSTRLGYSLPSLWLRERFGVASSSTNTHILLMHIWKGFSGIFTTFLMFVYAAASPPGLFRVLFAMKHSYMQNGSYMQNAFCLSLSSWSSSMA